MTSAPEPQPPDDQAVTLAPDGHDRYVRIDVVPDRGEAHLPDDLPKPPPDLFDWAIDAAIDGVAWLASMRGILGLTVFAGSWVSTGAPMWAVFLGLPLGTAAWLLPKRLLSAATEDDQLDLREDLAGATGFGLAGAMVAGRSLLGTIGGAVWDVVALACVVSAVLVVRRARRRAK